MDVASAPVSPESRQQVFDRADAIATLFGNPGLIVDHYRDTYTQADALERQGRIRDAETLRAQAALDLLSMVAGGAGLARTAVATLPRVAELAKLAAAGGKSTAGAGIASVTADAKAVLPAGYSELKSAGSAANTTGGLPDGHRRVVAPDGDIVILAPDGKVYASIDEIPSAGAGSSGGGGVLAAATGVVASRVNVRTGSANVTGSGLEYAWKKHGGAWSANKSAFTISKDELKAVLQSQRVVNTPAYQSPTSGNYIRTVDIGKII